MDNSSYNTMEFLKHLSKFLECKMSLNELQTYHNKITLEIEDDDQLLLEDIKAKTMKFMIPGAKVNIIERAFADLEVGYDTVLWKIVLQDNCENGVCLYCVWKFWCAITVSSIIRKNPLKTKNALSLVCILMSYDINLKDNIESSNNNTYVLVYQFLHLYPSYYRLFVKMGHMTLHRVHDDYVCYFCKIGCVPINKKFLKKCNSCGADDYDGTFKVCAGCRTGRYCSKKCQHTDWVNHKKLCASQGSNPLE